MTRVFYIVVRGRRFFSFFLVHWWFSSQLHGATFWENVITSVNMVYFVLCCTYDPWTITWFKIIADTSHSWNLYLGNPFHCAVSSRMQSVMHYGNYPALHYWLLSLCWTWKSFSTKQFLIVTIRSHKTLAQDGIVQKCFHL